MRELYLPGENNYQRWVDADCWEISDQRPYIVTVSEEKKVVIRNKLLQGDTFNDVNWNIAGDTIRFRGQNNAEYKVVFYAEINDGGEGVSLFVRKMIGDAVHAQEVDDIMFGTITARIIAGLDEGLPPAQEAQAPAAGGGGGWLAGVLQGLPGGGNPPMAGGRRRKARKTRRGRKGRKGRKSRGRRS